MIVEEILKCIERERELITLLSEEYEWRLQNLQAYFDELKQQAAIVKFCNTGKFND